MGVLRGSALFPNFHGRKRERFIRNRGDLPGFGRGILFRAGCPVLPFGQRMASRKGGAPGLPLLSWFARVSIPADGQKKGRDVLCTKQRPCLFIFCVSYTPSFSAHLEISFSLAFQPKRFPSFNSAPGQDGSSSRLVFPIPLPPEVAKGTMVLPLKS